MSLPCTSWPRRHTLTGIITIEYGLQIPLHDIRAAILPREHVQVDTHQTSNGSPAINARITGGPATRITETLEKMNPTALRLGISVTLAPYHLEGVLHRPAKAFVVTSRNRRNAPVAATHAVKDGLSVHLNIHKRNQDTAQGNDSRKYKVRNTRFGDTLPENSS